MKRRILIAALCAEALICVLLCALRSSFVGGIAYAMAFPFAQIGAGLRSLSLSGEPGNAVAILIYCAIGLIPAAALPVIRKKRRLRAEDGLLALLSAAIFAILYMMINPGILGPEIIQAAALPIIQAVLGGIAYSVLCGYAVMRVLRQLSTSGTERLLRYLSAMLGILGAIFIYVIFGALFSGLLASISALMQSNSGNGWPVGADCAFLVLRYIADAIPYFLNILIAFAGLRMLDEMRADRYSDQTLAAAGRVSRLCAAALAATTLVSVGFNLFQLVFIKELAMIDATLQIPVFSILFVLASLLITRLIAENKTLKDDNDLFV